MTKEVQRWITTGTLFTVLDDTFTEEFCLCKELDFFVFVYQDECETFKLHTLFLIVHKSSEITL